MGMFGNARSNPDVVIEQVNGSDYFQVTRRCEFSRPCTVITGIVSGVTFSLDIPGDPTTDQVDAILRTVATAIRENVLLDARATPGENRITSRV